MSTESPSARFFCYSNGNGFAKYEPLSAKMGNLWVMGKRESAWVLAGSEGLAWIDGQLSGGHLWEFFPARLLGGSTSAAKAAAARANGAKGGRPRKSV